MLQHNGQVLKPLELLLLLNKLVANLLSLELLLNKQLPNHHSHKSQFNLNYSHLLKLLELQEPHPNGLILKVKLLHNGLVLKERLLLNG